MRLWSTIMYNALQNEKVHQIEQVEFVIHIIWIICKNNLLENKTCLSFTSFSSFKFHMILTNPLKLTKLRNM